MGLHTNVVLWSPSRDQFILLIPLAATASFLYACLVAIVHLKRLRRVSRKGKPTRSNALEITLEEVVPKSKGAFLSAFQRVDGAAITSFRCLRLLAVATLVAVPAIQIAEKQVASLNYVLLVNFIYIGALCAVGLFSLPEVRDKCNSQASLLLFLDFAVYFSLDVWPFLTTDTQRFHPDTGLYSRIRLVCLTISGVLVPLLSPRPFRPSRDDEPPIPAHVAPLMSRLTYGFMDAIIFRAWRVPHIEIDELPPLPVKEEAEVLRSKAFRHLDPVMLRKNRYMFWGMLRVFWKDYLLVLFWMLGHATARFAAPFGMKNLLSYVETGVSPFGLKPWVWIFVLAFGPVLTAFLNNQWLYDGTRTIAETDSIMTQLVFEHSLRIRLNQGESGEKSESTSKKDSFTETASSTVEASEDTAVETEVDSDDNESDAETVVSEPDTEKRTDMKTETKHIVGRINNLITSDLTTIDYSYASLLLPGIFLQLGISIWFLYEVVGWSAFVGAASIAISLPIPTYLGKLVIDTQKQKMRLTDKRVQGVTESLGVLRMIKLFAWESRVMDDLFQRRADELKISLKQRLIEVLLRQFASLMPLLAKLATFSVYALVMKGEITASRMFTAMMVFTMMEEQIHSISYRIPDLLKVKVAYDRFNEFINGTKMLDVYSTEEKIDEQTLLDPVGELEEVGFKECTFTWDDPTDRSERSRRERRFKLKFSEKLVFEKGCVNIIVGPTGSGKTSILMALLGEMHYKPHGLSSWYKLPRAQGIAYVPQESWVLNETIRNNILLGSDYNEGRYKKVLQQCALERDLSLLEAGDLTEVGEKGLTLSGGQKARVTLARALYSPASILLLDDILAALDVHTSKWIVEEALSGDLIAGRTVILVTHNIALTAPIARRVVLLGKNGRIAEVGTVDEVLKSNSRLRAQAEKERREEAAELAKESAKAEDGDENEAETKQKTGKLVVAEEIVIGRVAWKSMKLYILSFGGAYIWAAFLGLESSVILVNIYQKWIMGYWSDQYETHPASEVNAFKFLMLYAFGSVLEQVVGGLANAFYTLRSVVASRVINEKLMRSIFSSTFRWLDVTPVGRIIARCTQDIGAIDGGLQANLNGFLYLTIVLSLYFTTSVIMAGLHALVPGIVMIGLGAFLGHVYLKASLCMRREMSNLKGPMISQVTTALGALPSIRAYGAQSFFREALKKKVNLYTRASLAFYDSNRWVAIRVESLGGLFAGSVSVFFIYGSNLPPGYIGFTLSMLVNFSRIILGWVRVYNEFELQSNSVERIQGYLDVEHEVPPTKEGIPPAYWPSSGKLRVEDLCARYSDDSPEILHNLNFEIESGQRVGIVGRTGAGKSTITLALLRAIKTTGKVFYDGIAIDTINLDALRSNVTVIPQQPELIQGTLRENLDPFGQHDDAELNGALRAAGLFDLHVDSEGTVIAEAGPSTSTSEDSNTVPADIAVEGIARRGDKIGLDTKVESGGTNFSLGQRQIVALARAIVRRSKLLILDEATAAIDYATDVAIQKALRTEFDKDTTFITVAHRLQTIMDYDKIMVLDNGNLAEFDTPANLIGKENGLLRALVDESEDRDLLVKMAMSKN
ncbi:P-loop containing nucleoside triphosphate hydrolase protein [Schizopora paradoxa]|uniref:p-loop containing nucleoside triphosphate hydrolase protein n=1 Tax=Schizopora paradoxa TaxID=27342 RepID=A0A0H2S3X5_9AGAM|nr:P-loop containing nucleoside triphosphate hydrolase protein [Schizopora paradoxa]